MPLIKPAAIVGNTDDDLAVLHQNCRVAETMGSGTPLDLVGFDNGMIRDPVQFNLPQPITVAFFVNMKKHTHDVAGFNIHEFSSLEDSEKKLKLIREAADMQADGSFEDKSYQAALEHGDDPQARDAQRTLKRATMMYDLKFSRNRVYYATREKDSKVVGCATVLFVSEEILEKETKNLKEPDGTLKGRPTRPNSPPGDEHEYWIDLFRYIFNEAKILKMTKDTYVKQRDALGTLGKTFYDIGDLVVHQDYRKQNIATRIIEHIVKVHGKDHVITLETSSGHVQSVSSKLGFKEFDSYQVADSNGNTVNSILAKCHPNLQHSQKSHHFRKLPTRSFSGIQKIPMKTSLAPATSVGLSDLPVELVAHILGYLDSYEDLATCLSSSAVFLDGFLYRRNTTLFKVVCRSIGYECLPDALAIVRCPDFSDITDRDEMRTRINSYLTDRASQDPWPCSRKEVVMLCQLDRVIMRFVDDLVRKAKSDNWAAEEGCLPHWADSSFSYCGTASQESTRPAITRAESTRYRRAWLRHELFNKVFIRNKAPSLFRSSQQSRLLLDDLEMWEIVGIQAIHMHLKDLHMMMLDSLYDEIQSLLLNTAAQPSIPGRLNSGHDQANMVGLRDVADDVFPYLHWSTRSELLRSLAEDDIASIYNRIRSGHDGFRHELRVRGSPLRHNDIMKACAYREEKLLRAGHTPSATFPGPTDSWEAGLRPINSIIVHERVGNTDIRGFKFFSFPCIATKGLVFLDGPIDTRAAFRAEYQVSSVRELEAQEDSWVEEFDDEYSAFIEAFNGLCINKDVLASFQANHGATANTN
ncbi:hypothetical protein PG991_011296 [Apiospora marii]|uniref:N-acetyltransferase domain-containing protein n=1 Tax=Apiospora marii TaxID=335849 RepID=A0ABR1RE10_9PEZI